jgi:hypothetical protein
MKWMKERDLLIAQTVAFVESVTGKKPGPDLLRPAPSAPETANPPPAVVAPVALTPGAQHASAPAKPIQVAPAKPPIDVQSEIRARVASFRAHQARFSREREDYCSTTLAKVRASLQADRQSPQTGK